MRKKHRNEGPEADETGSLPLTAENAAQPRGPAAPHAPDAAGAAPGRALGALVRRTDHDVRSPLNTIVGWAHLLERDASDAARVRHAAGIIGRNARLIAALLDELSDLTRVALGERALVATPVSLHRFVMDLVDAEQQHAQQCRVQLVRIEPHHDCNVLLDTGRLRGPLARLLEQIVAAAAPDSRVEVEVATSGPHARLHLRCERTRDPHRLTELPSAAAVALLLSRQAGASLRPDVGHALLIELPMHPESAASESREPRTH